jgi:hypothetical protein
VSLFITGIETGVGKDINRRAAFPVIVRLVVLGELGENLTQLPADCGFMFHSVACRVDTGL